MKKTTLTFKTDRECWKLVREMKDKGFQQVANAYWCYIFEKNGEQVILERIEQEFENNGR